MNKQKILVVIPTTASRLSILQNVIDSVYSNKEFDIKTIFLERVNGVFSLRRGFEINKNDNVLIIDDLIATGGTAEAAAKLVEISKSRVAAFIFVINLFDLGGSDNLIKNNYKVENLIDFPGH